MFAAVRYRTPELTRVLESVEEVLAQSRAAAGDGEGAGAGFSPSEYFAALVTLFLGKERGAAGVTPALVRLLLVLLPRVPAPLLRAKQSFLRSLLSQVLLGDGASAAHEATTAAALLHTLPHALTLALCGDVIQVVGSAASSPEKMSTALRTLDYVFQAPFAQYRLYAGDTQQLATALLDTHPQAEDFQSCALFCSTLASALIRLMEQDRDACIALLPRAMLALVSFLESPYTEVHCGAVAGAKRVLSTCVDNQLIREHVHNATPAFPLQQQQQVDQLDQLDSKPRATAGSNASASASGGGSSSTLENVLCAIENALQFHYHLAWFYSLDLVRCTINHLASAQPATAFLLARIVSRLADMHEAIASEMIRVSADMLSALKDTIVLAITTIGMQTFVVHLLPLHEAAGPGKQRINDRRIWLLPLLRTAAKSTPTQLAFIRDYVLPLARTCNDRARALTATPVEAQSERLHVLQLWSLVPPIAGSAQDIELVEGLTDILLAALHDENYPELTTVVCSTVQAVTHAYQPSQSAYATEGDAAAAAASTEVPAPVAHLASEMLPVLFNMLEHSTFASPQAAAAAATGAATGAVDGGEGSGERISILLATIPGVMACCPPDTSTPLLKRLIKNLLQSTMRMEGAATIQAPARAAALLSLAAGITPSLQSNGPCAKLMFQAVAPLVNLDTEPLVQKRAYKVIAALYRHCPGFIFDGEGSAEEHVVALQEAHTTCHVMSRHMRLRCLLHAVTALAEQASPEYATTTAATWVGEVLLGFKDSNQKTRTTAYEVFDEMEGLVPSYPAFVTGVSSTLAALTPQMRSAGVLGIGRLIFRAAATSRERLAYLCDTLPNLIDGILNLVRSEAPEEGKAVVVLIRILAAKLPTELLTELAPRMIQAMLLDLPAARKNKQLAKIRIIMSKLCRRIGSDLVMQHTPDRDRRLVTSVARKNRKSEAKYQARRKEFEAFLASDEEDNGEDDDVDGPDNDEDDGDGAGRARSVVSRAMSRRTGTVADMPDVRLRNTADDRGPAVLDLLDDSLLEQVRVRPSAAGAASASAAVAAAAAAGAGGHRAQDVWGRNRTAGDDGDSDDDDDDDDNDDNGDPDAMVVVRPDGKIQVGRHEEEEEGMEGEGRVGEAGGEGEEDEEYDDGDEGGARDPSARVVGRKRVRRGAEGSSAGSADGYAAAREIARRGGSATAAAAAAAAAKSAASGATSGPGSQYRSRKGAGDVWRKGQLEPYAYIPLDPKMLSRKKQRRAVAEYGQVVATGKKLKKAAREAQPFNRSKRRGRKR